MDLSSWQKGASPLITRCPNCGTSFRVTESQLNAANGAVRCGACLQVFAADEHLISTADGRADDDLVDGTESGVRNDETGWEETAPPDAFSGRGDEAAGEEWPADAPGGGEEYGSASEEEDRHIAGRLDEGAFGDGEDGNAPEDIGTGQAERFGSDDYESRESAEDDRADEPGGDDYELLENAEIDWADEFGSDEYRPWEDAELDWIDEFGRDRDAWREAEETGWADTPGAGESGTLEREDATDELDIGESQNDIEVDFTGGEQSRRERIDDADAMEVDETQGFIGNLEVEDHPDDIIGTVSEPTGRRTVLWTAGSLALLIAIGLQYAWMHRQALAQEIEYREYFLTVCTYLGCEIPEYRDRAALRTTSLLVRSHPELDDALLVDALLRNEAGFRQPFPALDLVFTDTRNEVVAARRLRPSEYLGGEMTGLKYIPGRTEVRLSIEIVDPGEDALGYALTVAEDW